MEERSLCKGDWRPERGERAGEREKGMRASGTERAR